MTTEGRRYLACSSIFFSKYPFYLIYNICGYGRQMERTWNCRHERGGESGFDEINILGVRSTLLVSRRSGERCLGHDPPCGMLLCRRQVARCQGPPRPFLTFGRERRLDVR